MIKCLHEYLDRSKVGRLDYLRQLIFLTFTPLATILSPFTCWEGMG